MDSLFSRILAPTFRKSCILRNVSTVPYRLALCSNAFIYKAFPALYGAYSIRFWENIFNFSEKTSNLIDFLSAFGLQYFYEKGNVLYQT